jgi:RHS repeat-associated protein
MTRQVSLTLIVKNEESTLPACLASVAGLVDEIVVVDTGSTDRTKEVAAGLGARVVDFPWCDDFAAARLTGVDNNGTPSAPHLVLTYGYDGHDNVLSVTDNLNGSVTYNYDNDHNLTSASMVVSSVQGPNAALSYDSRNRLTGMTRMVSNAKIFITSSDTYDDANRLTNITYVSHVLTQSTTLASYTYSYDSANQLTGYVGPDGTLTYSYDSDGQLTGAAGAHAETYTYDKNGNRTMTGYSTGTGNRLTNDGTYTYTYDNEGNTLTKTRTSDGQTTTFTWDYRNRLTEVIVKTSGGTTMQDDKFTYDVENRRIGKNTLSGGQMWTLYDGVNPYADFNSSLSLTFRYLYGRAIDSLLARWDGTNALWYLTDKLGSVRMDATTSGSISDQLVYDSYGNIVSETSSSSGDRFKFTGREWDAEIGQYFYRARYLSPSDGRFENEDPKGFGAGDTDLFRYVRNGPTNATDPLGLWRLDLTITLSVWPYAGVILRPSIGTGGFGFAMGGYAGYQPHLASMALELDPFGAKDPTGTSMFGLGYGYNNYSGYTEWTSPRVPPPPAPAWLPAPPPPPAALAPFLAFLATVGPSAIGHGVGTSSGHVYGYVMWQVI